MAVVAVVMAATATSCGGREPDYSSFVRIAESGWAYGDTLRYAVVLPDSVDADGVLTLSVCHNNDYPYANLWLEVSVASGDSAATVDTLDMRLATIHGQWLGRGFGSMYQATDTLGRPLRLGSGQQVKVRHIMRVDTLDDIEQIGISFVANK